MLTLALTLLLTQAPPMPQIGAPPGPPPKPQDLVALYFRTGDLRKAVEHCRAWMKTSKKQPTPVFKALVQYQFLASRISELTLEEAKQFLAFDAIVSPGTPALLTKQVRARFVEGPMEMANAAALANHRERALQLARDVLAVEPGNAAAHALLHPSDSGVQPVAAPKPQK